MRIRKLPETFVRLGCEFNLIFREKDVAAYNVTRLKNGKFLCIEVVKVMTGKPHPKFKNEEGYDRVESFPATERWGTYGWTVKTVERAYSKIEELLQRRKQKNL